MGHTWREMDPVGAEAQDQYLDRLLALRERFKKVPLGKFKVGELPLLMKLMDQGEGIEMTEEELQKLEKKKFRKLKK